MNVGYDMWEHGGHNEQSVLEKENLLVHSKSKRLIHFE